MRVDGQQVGIRSIILVAWCESVRIAFRRSDVCDGFTVISPTQGSAALAVFDDSSYAWILTHDPD